MLAGLAVAMGCPGHDDAPMRYVLTGTILTVDRRANTLVVRHDSIQGFMCAMTMRLAVADRRDLNALAGGDRIRAGLAVTRWGLKLEHIQLMDRPQGLRPPGVAAGGSARP